MEELRFSAFVGLVKKEFCSMAPAIAELGTLMRKREDVVGSVANRAQDCPTLGR
jgi:hypothetical protein